MLHWFPKDIYFLLLNIFCFPFKIMAEKRTLTSCDFFCPIIHHPFFRIWLSPTLYVFQASKTHVFSLALLRDSLTDRDLFFFLNRRWNLFKFTLLFLLFAYFFYFRKLLQPSSVRRKENKKWKKNFTFNTANPPPFILRCSFHKNKVIHVRCWTELVSPSSIWEDVTLYLFFILFLFPSQPCKKTKNPAGKSPFSGTILCVFGLQHQGMFVTFYFFGRQI